MLPTRDSSILDLGREAEGRQVAPINNTRLFRLQLLSTEYSSLSL